MIAALGYVLDGVMLIGDLVLWAIETFTNLFLAAIVALYTALIALLPHMDSAPAVGQPEWLRWLSWFYPVGDLLAGLAIAVTAWVTFLAVRWALRLVRGI